MGDEQCIWVIKAHQQNKKTHNLLIETSLRPKAKIQFLFSFCFLLSLSIFLYIFVMNIYTYIYIYIYQVDRVFDLLCSGVWEK